MAPVQKKVEREGGKKKEMITVEVMEIEKYKCVLRVAEVARFYTKSTSVSRL